MMEMVEHTVTVRGPRVSAGRPCADAIGRILLFIEPVVRKSISMGFRNTSAVPGRRHAWFKAAGDIRFLGMSPGDGDATRLHFGAPRFGEAAEDLYKQHQLFKGLRPQESETGFDLLGDVLDDIRGRVEDSLRFDPRLLKDIRKFSTYPSKRGIDSVAISGDRLPEDHPPTLDTDLCTIAESLCRMAPSSTRARVAGTLDMIRDHDNVFELILQDNTTVRGLWTGGEMRDLADLFERDVVVEGGAVFRPSGNLLRIEAEAIRPATDQDDFFRRIPEPTLPQAEQRSLLRPQKAGEGADAIYGKWPGEESEEDILAALKEMG